jgi:hypothetical protein
VYLSDPYREALVKVSGHDYSVREMIVMGGEVA